MNDHDIKTVNELLLSKKAKEVEIVYVLGNIDIHAKKDSWFF